MEDHGELHHEDELLSPLELHILDLCAELATAIAGLVGDDDSIDPLGEFDQRLLLEHTQLIERYVLAQAGARAYPERFRQIGRSVPGTTTNSHDPEHAHSVHHEHDDDTGHDHDHSGEQHLVADPSAARETHRQGRAIIGEHPWGHDHEHSDDHNHADEWEWEPIDSSTTE